MISIAKKSVLKTLCLLLSFYSQFPKLNVVDFRSAWLRNALFDLAQGVNADFYIFYCAILFGDEPQASVTKSGLSDADV